MTEETDETIEEPSPGSPWPATIIQGAVVRALNSLCEADPRAMAELANNRAECCFEMADVPGVVCQAYDAAGERTTEEKKIVRTEVGLIGVVNAILDELGANPIAMAFYDHKELDGMRLARRAVPLDDEGNVL